MLSEQQPFGTYHPGVKQDLKPSSFIARHPYGKGAEDDSGSEDDTPLGLSEHERQMLATATPGLRESIKQARERERLQKMGPVKTFFTLIKGFVATAVLFLPKGFKNGGYIFSPVALTASAILTFYCAVLLLRVRDKARGSFSEIG